MTTSSISVSNPWRLKLLIFWNVLGIFLFVSLFAPYTSSLWEQIDASLFRFFNQPLKSSHHFRLFWAAANHRLADWFEDLCILGFYLAAVFKVRRADRLKMSAKLLFCVLLIGMTILLINRLVCRDYLRLRRTSPSLVFSDAVYLSDFLTWISVKINTNKSFPGDHATTALMFACSYAYIVRGKLAFLALLYGIFLCLPRLIVGAHWPSDIIVGSGCITIFSLSWAFCTPLAEKCSITLHKLLQKWFKSNNL